MEFKQDSVKFPYEPPGGRRSRARVAPQLSEQQGVILTRIIRKDGNPQASHVPCNSLTLAKLNWPQHLRDLLFFFFFLTCKERNRGNSPNSTLKNSHLWTAASAFSSQHVTKTFKGIKWHTIMASLMTVSCESSEFFIWRMLVCGTSDS